MSDIYVVAIDGLAATRPLDAIADREKQAALRAVNYAAQRARTRGARAIRDQVNFRARDLTGETGRLMLSKAKSFDDEAVIRGRFRPTSLAYFVTSGQPGPAGAKRGVTMMVQPGLARRSKRMFLIRLRAGTADLDTKSNLGLAIRLKPGETIQHKHTMARLGKNLYLLYGSSVNQIFRSVAEEDVPSVEDDLSREFTRLMGVNL